MTELERAVCAKLYESYEEMAKEAVANAPVEFMEGAYIEMALGSVRQGIVKVPELVAICRQGGLDFAQIVEDEYEKARKRHLM